MSERIRAVREALGLSQRLFGEKLGVSRDVISNIEGNRVSPKELFLQHMCEQFKVNRAWLETGNGDMFYSKQEIDGKLEEVLRIFESLCPEFQDYAIEQIRKLAELQEKM